VIGNDIIDLNLAQKQSNWQRNRFLAKIFTAAEQKLILNSDAPELMVWNLWSRKEAAYKIYNRQTQVRAYIPLQLECFDLEISDTLIYGKVMCRGNCYFTKTKITSDYIDTVAVLNPADFAKIKTLNQSVEIVKTNNIPNYLPSEKITVKPMSKSHHGRFERWVTLSD
jgi:phosphopantetheinyl transferase (holo-ACP synthase)